MATHLEIELPEDVRAALLAAGYTVKQMSEEARRHYAAVLFARRTLMLEQAARMAEMSMWDFLPFLSEQGIAVLDYDNEEFSREMEAVRWLTGRLLAVRGRGPVK